MTNEKCAGHFQKWSDDYRATRPKLNFTIVSNGSTDDTNKLGAIGDIHFVLKTQNVDDDLVIVGGDNLFSQKLDGFGSFCRGKNAPVLALYDVGDLEQIKKYNSISTDAAGHITFFEEKPKHPTSTLTGIALIIIPSPPSPSSSDTLPKTKSRPARLPHPMALFPHNGLYLARAGHLARYRLKGNAGRSQPNLRKALRGGWFALPRRNEMETGWRPYSLFRLL